MPSMTHLLSCQHILQVSCINSHIRKHQNCALICQTLRLAFKSPKSSQWQTAPRYLHGSILVLAGELTATVGMVACQLHMVESAFPAFPMSRILPLRRCPLAHYASDFSCVNKWIVTETHLATSLARRSVIIHYNASLIQPLSTFDLIKTNASSLNL